MGKIIFFTLVASIAFAGCKAKQNINTTTNKTQIEGQQQVVQPEAQEGGQLIEPALTTTSGLIIEDLKLGKGVEVIRGDQLTVHYEGRLTNGRKFDSSKDFGEPFRFVVGRGRVISGWDEGLIGMKQGGVRKLTIPPSLAYGESGSGEVIPPNSTLVFEIELLKIDQNN